MAKVRGQGFNKEKLMFLVSAVALAAVGYHYFISAPLSLSVGDPLSTENSPSNFVDTDYSLKQPPDFYVQRKRKSPFTPDRFWKTEAKKKVVKVTKPVSNVPPPPAPPPPSQKDDSDPDSRERGPMRPTERDLQVKFMGVVMMGGSSYALLSRKDGGNPHRVKLGETIEDLNYKITRIEKQAIHLEDEEGNPYVLKNTRFGAAGGGESDTGRKQMPDLPGLDGLPEMPRPKPSPKTKPKKSTSSKGDKQKARDKKIRDRRKSKRGGK